MAVSNPRMDYYREKAADIEPFRFSSKAIYEWEKKSLN